MFERLEEPNQRVWGDKIMLASTAHVLGGIGIGLLVNCATARRARPLAYLLLGLSGLAHLYAFLTARAVHESTFHRAFARKPAITASS